MLFIQTSSIVGIGTKVTSSVSSAQQLVIGKLCALTNVGYISIAMKSHYVAAFYVCMTLTVRAMVLNS